MNQRILYLIVILLAAIMISNTKPIPVSIHRIEGMNQFDAIYQVRRTLEKADDEPSIYSDLELVPEDYTNECYSQWDHWSSNGLADRLGNPIGWQRAISWNDDCDPEGQVRVYEDVYNILISKNPMIAYPDFSNLDETLITESGIEVSLSSIDYPYTISGTTTVYERVKYTFKVKDVYVFIGQTRLRDESNEIELLEWVDKLYDEIQTILN
jgi:hypothetical protein